MRVIVSIMAGGGGTRLFPLSQTEEGKLPKQFLAVVKGDTLLQKAIKRVPESFGITVIPESRYASTVVEQAAEIGRDVSVIAEPFGCNTAAAILYASAHEAYTLSHPETILCFIPADHEMDSDVFAGLLERAVRQASERDCVVTIGIEPTRAETNYGYIRAADSDGTGSSQVLSVKEFVEKPDHETAVSYLDHGGYFWNAGIFVARARVLLDKAGIHCPGIVNPIIRACTDGDPMTQESAYREIKKNRLNISIDYALMEKIADSMVLVPAPEELEWNDLGNWESLERYMVTDEQGNAVFDTDLASFSDSQQMTVCNYTEIPVFIKGCEQLLIVITEHGILIRPRDRG